MQLAARQIVWRDEGLPLDLLVHRISQTSIGSLLTEEAIRTGVRNLILAGWLKEVSEGRQGHIPVSRRIYIAVPTCVCGDSLFSGCPCPDESTQTEWPCHGLEHCPARKRAGIDHG
jgi:hypothetical protein